MDAGNGSYGNMFDIVAKQNIIISTFKIHARIGSYSVEVWTKSGTYVDNIDLNGWTQVLSNTTTGAGEGSANLLPLFSSPVAISIGSKQAFYVTLNSKKIRYSNGSTEGALYKSNDHIEFFEGVGYTSNPPSDGIMFSPRVFNGYILYYLGSD